MVIVGLISGFVLFVRKPDSLVNPQLWAEDGVIFFQQQLELGLGAIFTPYNGYLHLAPRLVAAFADRLFPYCWVPAVYNYLCLLITIGVAVSVYSNRLSISHRPLLALSLVFVPHFENEVFLNITNLQWILCPLLLVTLFKTAPSGNFFRKGLSVASDFLLLLLCGLSGPFLLLLSPFFVGRALIKRDSYSVVLAGVVFIITLVQLSFIHSQPPEIQGEGPDLEVLLELIGKRFLGELFLGVTISAGLPSFIWVLLLPLFCVYFWKILQARHWRSMVCLSFGVILFLAVLYKFKNDWGILLPSSNGPRYFFLPYLMTIWSIILLQEKIKISGWIALLFILIASLTSGFRSDPLPDKAWHNYCERIGEEPLVVPINPEGWKIRIEGPDSE